MKRKTKSFEIENESFPAQESIDDTVEATSADASISSYEPETIIPPKGQSSGTILRTVFTYLVPFLLLCGFIAFAIFSERTTTIELITAAISVFCFAVLLLRFLPKLFAFFEEPEKPETAMLVGERSRKKLHPVLKTILTALFGQLIAIVAVYVLANLVHATDGSIIDAYRQLFISPHGSIYADTIPQAFRNVGILGLFVTDTHVDLLVSKYLLPVFAVNTAAVCAASVAMYELMIIDHSKRTSKFAVSLLFASPSVLLVLQPLNGVSFFMLLMLFALILLRRQKYLTASVFAIFAAAFNFFALLITLPIIIEGINEAIRIRQSEDCEKRPVGGIIARTVIGALLPIAVAVLVILYWRRTGSGFDAIMLPIHYFFEPLGMLTREWIASESTRILTAISIASLVFFAIFALLSIKKQRASLSLLSILYLALAPSLFGLHYILYSVFAFPLLASMEASVCSRRYLRTMWVFAALITTVLLTVFLYVRKLV